MDKKAVVKSNINELNLCKNKIGKTKINDSKRYGFIELYRFIAIFFVVIIHVLDNIPNEDISISVLHNNYFWQLLLPFTKTAVAFFLVTSAFFLYNNNNKFYKLAIWIVYYALVGLIGNIIWWTLEPNHGYLMLINNWFIWALVIIHVLSYFFNCGKEKIKKSYFLTLLVFSGIGFILNKISFEIRTYNSYGEFYNWMYGSIFIFLLITYLQMYHASFFVNKATVLGSLIVLILVMIYYSIYVALSYRGYHVQNMLYLIVGQVDPVGLIFILAIFILLLNLKHNHNPIFLGLGKISAGIFLLHILFLPLVLVIVNQIYYLNINLIVLITWLSISFITIIASITIQLFLYPLFEKLCFKIIKNLN